MAEHVYWFGGDVGLCALCFYKVGRVEIKCCLNQDGVLIGWRLTIGQVKIQGSVGGDVSLVESTSIVGSSREDNFDWVETKCLAKSR